MAEGVGGDNPGILTLLDLHEEHRAAFEYDWRHRFHLGLSAIPSVMGWGEAWRLTQRLMLDPSSHAAASVAGWDQPWSREAFIAADTYDLLAKVNVKRPTPYPRPFDKRKTTFGKATRPQSAIRAALLARGPLRVLYHRDARGRLHDEKGRFIAG